MAVICCFSSTGLHTITDTHLRLVQEVGLCYDHDPSTNKPQVCIFTIWFLAHPSPRLPAQCTVPQITSHKPSQPHQNLAQSSFPCSAYRLSMSRVPRVRHWASQSVFHLTSCTSSCNRPTRCSLTPKHHRNGSMISAPSNMQAQSRNMCGFSPLCSETIHTQSGAVFVHLSGCMFLTGSEQLSICAERPADTHRCSIVCTRLVSPLSGDLRFKGRNHAPQGSRPRSWSEKEMTLLSASSVLATYFPCHTSSEGCCQSGAQRPVGSGSVGEACQITGMAGRNQQLEKHCMPPSSRDCV